MRDWSRKQIKWSQEEIAVGTGTFPPSQSLDIIIPEGGSVDLTIDGTTLTYPFTGATFNVGQSLSFSQSDSIGYEVTTGTIIAIRSW